MANPDWRPAMRYLRSRVARATKEQHALAGSVGLELKATTPRLIAAAELRDHLANQLDESVRLPSFEQLELIEELSNWRKSSDPKPQTHAMAHAVIDLLEARRELEAISALKPARGDIVYGWSWWKDRRSNEVDQDRYRLISSVSDDGTVHFVGGGGRRARASQIEILFRADDKDPKAVAARRAAEAAALDHFECLGVSREMSAIKAKKLQRWAVSPSLITTRDIDALRGVIETADDEAPIQKFLAARPYLLTPLLPASHGKWVRPQVRFGTRYVADFLIADSDSTGIRWRLIELESPRVRVLGRSGQWLKEARKAQDQIRTWRHYIRENSDAVRKPPSEEGLGLVDIEAGAPAFILISRRSIVAKDPAWPRRELSESAVEMHTYDWLMERIEGAAVMRGSFGR
jgi:Shedu protein SduA, C-terminal